jgi:hypothetical protein
MAAYLRDMLHDACTFDETLIALSIEMQVVLCFHVICIKKQNTMINL